MSIAALFGCSSLWNSSRNTHKKHSARLPHAPRPAASGCSYIDRSIATLVTCQPRPTSLIRNKTFSLFESSPIDLCWINKKRISPTAIEADIGSPMMLPSETVRVRRYVASSGWRIECRTKPKVEIRMSPVDQERLIPTERLTRPRAVSSHKICRGKLTRVPVNRGARIRRAANNRRADHPRRATVRNRLGHPK
jgi:hypothetical protein